MSDIVMSRERSLLWRSMSPATQKVAEELQDRLRAGAQGVVLIYYDIGKRVAEVCANEATYGSGAVAQLAAWLNIRGGAATLYSIKNFAERFDRDYVRQVCSQPMANGEYLTLAHWLRLSTVENPRIQEKLLQKTLRESLSAQSLEMEIRALGANRLSNRKGPGRPVSVPSNPMVGLYKLESTAHTFVNLLPAIVKGAVEPLEAAEPDSLNEAVLQRLRETDTRLSEVIEQASQMRQRIEALLRKAQPAAKPRRSGNNSSANDVVDQDEPPRARRRK